MEPKQPLKGDIHHILNALELGKFDAEDALAQQDKLAEQIQVALAEGNPSIPKTYVAAMQQLDAVKWRAACKAELKQMWKMNVWEQPLPPFAY
ncbi:hypothetical protein CROQUDRAFT_100761 [Cronartium quercuum f. sp. fusiforme G11]|uniref:Uncharacterized protein n=1 Tax=Cronartium quercuum f. sp. fusiforme G11 TaxID=708437 RepID=A0A9P6N5W9_9BASI|nr:hypothetical protein CROQUDRAFT_100761 [Cronartium quercuum f. sp. fusiforme G11]